MSNLIPTPIIDKNGVVSIRYKKPENGNKGSLVKAPVLAPQPAPEALLGEMHSGLIEVFNSENFSGVFTAPDLLHRRLKQYDQSLLTAFEDASVQSDHTDRLNYFALLASCLNNDLSSNEAGYVLFSVQTTGFVYDWSDQHAADEAYVDAYRIYVGIQSVLDCDSWHSVGWELPENIIDATDDDRLRYRALLRTALKLYEEDGEGQEWVNGDAYSRHAGVRFEDKSAYKYLVQNPDAADDVIALIEERNGLPYGIVEQVLNNPVQAVREGVL